MDYNLITLEISSHRNRSGNDGILPVSLSGKVYDRIRDRDPSRKRGPYPVWCPDSGMVGNYAGNGLRNRLRNPASGVRGKSVGTDQFLSYVFHLGTYSYSNCFWLGSIVNYIRKK